MKIELDKNNNIIGYVGGKSDIDGTEIEEYKFDRLQDEKGNWKYSYINNEIVENDNSNKPNKKEILQQVMQLKNQLNETDIKVLQHIREKTLNIDLTLSEDDYLALEKERQLQVEKIRDLQEKLDV